MDGTGGLSIGAIASIVAASCVLVILFFLGLRMTRFLSGKNPEDPGENSFNLKFLLFKVFPFHNVGFLAT